MAARTARAVGRDLRRDQFQRVSTGGAIELNRFTPASLITRATNDVQQIQMALLLTLSLMVQVPIVLVGGILMAVRQEGERQRFAAANERLQDRGLRIGMWLAFLFPAVMATVFVALAAIIFFGRFRIDAGAMQPGSLIVFINCLMQVLMAVMLAAPCPVARSPSLSRASRCASQGRNRRYFQG